MTAATKIDLFEQHPLSAAFPSMPEDDLAALAEDIKKNGQREPGVLYGGMVLDGWHRYLACQRACVEFVAYELADGDPVAFVLSRNLHRRHLTASQRAAAVVAAHNWKPLGVNQHSEKEGRHPVPTLTEKQMAEEAEVSERTIRQAKVAHQAGLGEAVKEGKTSAKTAAAVAKLPPKKRDQAVKAIKEGKAPSAPKPKPKDDAKRLAELIDLQGKYADLLEKNAELKDSLAEMADLAASAKAFEEKTEFKEMQVLRVELRSCKRRRDELMAENAQLKTEVKRWRKKAEAK